MKSGTSTGAVAGSGAFMGGNLASRTAPDGRLDSPVTGGSRLADMQVKGPPAELAITVQTAPTMAPTA